jgi:hypothetical protein
MAYKVKDLVPGLEYEDLLKLKRDLEKGGLHIKKLVDETLKEKEKEHTKYCAVCMSEIDPRSPNTYTLLFGPHDFKKKASFCGLDCLEYFVSNLRRIKEKRKK